MSERLPDSATRYNLGFPGYADWGRWGQGNNQVYRGETSDIDARTLDAALQEGRLIPLPLPRHDGAGGVTFAVA